MSDRRCDQSSPRETNANGGRRAREGDPYATSPSCRTATTRRGGGEAAERESEQGDGVGEDEEAQELRRDVEVFVLFWNAMVADGNSLACWGQYYGPARGSVRISILIEMLHRS